MIDENKISADVDDINGDNDIDVDNDFDDVDDINGDNYIVFIDESGGKHAADPRLRRCGWGISLSQRTHSDWQQAFLQ